MKDSLDLPAGFRFHPTDEELVNHYLCRKCGGQPISVPVIADVDLYKFDPWQLPGMALYGEKEWYFFSPRDRKYPNGSRPNRAAGNGYWKATGADKAIGKPKPVGIKKALVFYAGKAQGGVKTDWIMHEYRLANVDRAAGKKNGSRLDDWVLCRIYNKKGVIEKHCGASEKELGGEIEEPVVDGQLCGDTWRSETVGSPEGKYWSELESALDFRFNYFDEEVPLPPYGNGSHFCTGEDPLFTVNHSTLLQY